MLNRFHSALVFPALMLVSVTALAGGDLSGGGDVIICKTGFLSKQIYLADTYNLVQSLGLKNFGALDEGEILEIVSQKITSRNPSLGRSFDSALRALEFQFVKNIEEVEDDFLQMDSKKCQKRQVAVQDLSTGRVRIAKSLYHWLSVPEQAFLKAHEAFIRMRNREGNTSDIRQKIAAIFGDPDLQALTFRNATERSLDKYRMLKRLVVHVCTMFHSKSVTRKLVTKYAYGMDYLANQESVYHHEERSFAQNCDQSTLPSMLSVYLSRAGLRSPKYDFVTNFHMQDLIRDSYTDIGSDGHYRPVFDLNKLVKNLRESLNFAKADWRVLQATWNSDGRLVMPKN